jgi:hypothetical protein
VENCEQCENTGSFLKPHVYVPYGYYDDVINDIIKYGDFIEEKNRKIENFKMIHFTIRAYDEHHMARDMFQVICSSRAVLEKAEQILKSESGNDERICEEKRLAKKRRLMSAALPTNCEEKDGVTITCQYGGGIDNNGDDADVGFSSEEELKNAIKSIKIEIKRGDYNILERFTNIIRGCSLVKRDGSVKMINEWNNISVRLLKIGFSNDEFNQISMTIRVETNGMKYCLLKSNGGTKSLYEGSHKHNNIYFTFYTDSTYKNNFQKDYLSSIPFSNESLFKYKFYQRCFSIQPTKYKLYDRPDMITCKDLHASNYTIELLPNNVEDVHEVFKIVTSRVLSIIKGGSVNKKKNMELYNYMAKSLRFSDLYEPTHGLTQEDFAMKMASVNAKKKSYLFNRAVSSSSSSNPLIMNNNNSSSCDGLFECDMGSGIDSGSRSSHLIRSLIERAEKNDTTNDSNYYGNENGEDEGEEEELLDLNRESDDDDDDCIVLSNNSINNNNNREEKDSNGYEAFSFDDY